MSKNDTYTPVPDASASSPSLQIPADVLAKAYGLTRAQIRLCLHYVYRDEANRLVKSYTRATLDEPFTDTTEADAERERLAEEERRQARFKQTLLEEACTTAETEDDDPDDTLDDDEPWDGTLAVDV